VIGKRKIKKKGGKGTNAGKEQGRGGHKLRYEVYSKAPNRPQRKVKNFEKTKRCFEKRRKREKEKIAIATRRQSQQFPQSLFHLN